MLNCNNSTIKTGLQCSVINCNNYQNIDIFSYNRFPLEEERLDSYKNIFKFR